MVGEAAAGRDIDRALVVFLNNGLFPHHHEEIIATTHQGLSSSSITLDTPYPFSHTPC